MKYTVCLGMLLLSAVFDRPVGAQAGDKLPDSLPTKEIVLKQAKTIAKKTQTVIALAEHLDELTKTKGELTLKSAGRAPVAEKTFFAVEFRVPEVEFEDYITNKAWNWEVPGRRVFVKIKIDCQVECRVDVANIKLARHEDYDDTVVLTVPRLEVIGNVPEGREFTYEAKYGWLRAKWNDTGEARLLRRSMVTSASRKAAEVFGRSELMVEFRKGFKRELRAFIKPTVPEGRRIDIKFEDE